MKARQRRPEVSGELAARVPRSARHAVFDVVAYGEGGDEIGRHEYRSDVTN